MRIQPTKLKQFQDLYDKNATVSDLKQLAKHFTNPNDYRIVFLPERGEVREYRGIQAIVNNSRIVDFVEPVFKLTPEIERWETKLRQARFQLRNYQDIIDTCNCRR